ncbi:MAG: pyridoxal-dependent decarboxylase [Acidimicrobiia bacterium]
MGPDHMTWEEFRRHGHEAIDWVADYLETVGERPVFSTVEPGAVARSIPDTPPREGEPFEALLADLDDIVVPGITHWQSPNWFAYFPANTSPPSVLAEVVTSGLGVQGMLWSTSPAATEIESKVLDWLIDMMGLPDAWRSDGPGGGVIQMSASDSTHTALVVARHRNRERASAQNMVVYASTQAHSSVVKGCTVAGIGHARGVAVDEHWAVRSDALSAAIDEDLEAGLLPIAVVSSVGTTATTAVDPIARIAAIAQANALWHHVDAAYAGTAMVCDEFRHHIAGVDKVDSYTFNPHKWMMVNFDCNVLWVADRAPLIDTLSILPPYLRNAATESGAVIDYRDWHVPLGRRFRALKLWWVLRSYGVEGIQQLVRNHVALADALAARIVGDDRFDLFAPHPFGLVCFTHRDGNAATSDLAAALNASGRVAVTPSELDGTTFIRVSVGQTWTAHEHIDALWDLIDELANP